MRFTASQVSACLQKHTAHPTVTTLNPCHREHLLTRSLTETNRPDQSDRPSSSCPGNFFSPVAMTAAVQHRSDELSVTDATEWTQNGMEYYRRTKWPATGLVKAAPFFSATFPPKECPPFPIAVSHAQQQVKRVSIASLLFRETKSLRAVFIISLTTSDRACDSGVCGP
jgi:hypothetical protein